MRGNDNKLVKFTALILLVTLLALVLVSGTYARYTSKAAGDDTARVAKWSIFVGKDTSKKDITLTDNQTITFDLFTTINDTKDEAAETDVSSFEESDKVIAPGTKGSFKIDIENKSEVTAEYKIVYSITNTSNIPLEFTTTPDVDESWTKDIASLNKDFKTIAAKTGTAAPADTTIYWRWAFTTGTTGDDKDTELGTAGTATVTVKADLTAQQVD